MTIIELIELTKRKEIIEELKQSYVVQNELIEEIEDLINNFSRYFSSREKAYYDDLLLKYKIK